MRIQLDSTSLQPTDVGQATSSTGIGSGHYGGVSAGSSDSISLSRTSSLLSQAATARSARVSQLTADVRSGSYQVAASSVSHALIGDALLRG